MDQGAGSGIGVGTGRLELPAHLTRLLLACCNPSLVEDARAPASPKLAAFAETLDELLANRHKVPVFSQVVKHLKLVEEYLAGAGIAFQYLDGATPTTPTRLGGLDELGVVRVPGPRAARAHCNHR